MFLREQPSTLWEHDYVALMFWWWAPIGMCEDARGGQQPLFLRGKQRSFFLSFTLRRSNVRVNSESTPSRDFSKHKWRQITSVWRTPQNTPFAVTQQNLPCLPPPLPPIWTTSLPGGWLPICVWITSIIGDFTQLRVDIGKSATAQDRPR